MCNLISHFWNQTHTRSFCILTLILFYSQITLIQHNNYLQQRIYKIFPLHFFSFPLWSLEILGCVTSQHRYSWSPPPSLSSERGLGKEWNWAYITWKPSTGKSIKDHRFDFDSAVDKMLRGSRWVIVTFVYFKMFSPPYIYHQLAPGMRHRVHCALTLLLQEQNCFVLKHLPRVIANILYKYNNI